MKKLNLKVLDLGKTELLTREQLKNVTGGYVGSSCYTGPCSVYDSNTGTTHSGNCGIWYGPGWDNTGTCLCQTDLGSYTPTNGVSKCQY